MAESTDGHFKRPEITLQTYSKTARYTPHGSDSDKLAILVCRIRTWKAEGTDWFKIPSAENCLTIREVESVEINNAYDDLISKAVLHFPRGTVVSKRLRSSASVDAGTNDGASAVSKSVSDITADGDVLVANNLVADVGGSPRSKVYQKGDIVSMDGSQVQVGLTDMNRSKNDAYLLNSNDFQTENRIEIRLGYAYSEEEYDKMMRDDSNQPDNMEMVFTGFITKCSASTPLEVECENMAHVFTTINVPDIVEKGACTLKDFLDPAGKYHLLKDTGIELDLGKENFTIEVANFTISSQLTVADVLHQWQESSIMCFMKNYDDGTSKLRVGKNYNVDGGMGSLPIDKKEYITYQKGGGYYNVIQFDWDVAEDRLELMNTNKMFLAVKASGRTKEGKWLGFTLRRVVNDDGGLDWQEVNEKREVPKRRRKKKDGTYGKRPKGMRVVQMNKVRTNDLNIIQYVRILPCDRETLLKEAKEYWMNYNPTGISGSIVIFGDIKVEPADIIALIDPRQPAKNGWYMVKDVNITFGTNGYRKELKLPYKVANFDKFPVYVMQ